jgi:hypothetical protein
MTEPLFLLKSSDPGEGGEDASPTLPWKQSKLNESQVQHWGDHQSSSTLSATSTPIPAENASICSIQANEPMEPEENLMTYDDDWKQLEAWLNSDAVKIVSHPM